MDIPGLSSLLAIHHRHIAVANASLAQRKQFALELAENCRQWVNVLIEAFNRAAERWEIDGPEAARAEIQRQQQDFMALNYWTLCEESPILKHLDGDKQFRDFVEACRSFYKSALSTKQIAYEQIDGSGGERFSLQEDGARKVVRAWVDRLEVMLQSVEQALMEVRVIEQR